MKTIVVAGLHEKQDPASDQLWSETQIQIRTRNEVKSWIRNNIKLLQIRNPGKKLCMSNVDVSLAIPLFAKPLTQI